MVVDCKPSGVAAIPVSTHRGSLGIDLPVFQLWTLDLSRSFADLFQLTFIVRRELLCDAHIVFHLAGICRMQRHQDGVVVVVFLEYRQVHLGIMVAGEANEASVCYRCR